MIEIYSYMTINSIRLPSFFFLFFFLKYGFLERRSGHKLTNNRHSIQFTISYAIKSYRNNKFYNELTWIPFVRSQKHTHSHEFIHKCTYVRRKLQNT